LSQYDSRRRLAWRHHLTKPKAIAATVLAEPGQTGRSNKRRIVMLAAEHEAAEILRHQRLKAYAVRHNAARHLSWLLGLFGLARAH
jgi:hypothetical protein